MPKGMPRRSLLEGSVSPAAMSVSVPLSNPELDQTIAMYNDISVRANSFSDSMNKMSAKKAEAAGASFGAVRAPTLEEIEIAKELGQPISLPGKADSFSIFQQAAHQAGLAVVEDNYGVLASAALAEESAKASADPNMTPEMYLEQIDGVGESYVDILNSISPRSAAKLRANLFTERNRGYLAFSKAFFKKQKDEARSFAVIMAGEIAEVSRLENQFSGFLYTPGNSPFKDLEAQRARQVEHLKNNGATLADIDKFNDLFNKNVLEAQQQYVVESIMRGDYGDITLLDAAQSLNQSSFGREVFAPKDGQEFEESAEPRDVLQSVFNNLDKRDQYAVTLELRKKHDELKNLERVDDAAKEKERTDRIEVSHSVIWDQIQYGPTENQSVQDWYDNSRSLIMKSIVIPREAGEGDDADFTKTALLADLNAAFASHTQQNSEGEKQPTAEQDQFFHNTLNDILTGQFTKKSWLKKRKIIMQQARDLGLPHTGNHGVNINAIVSEYRTFAAAQKTEVTEALANARRVIFIKFGIDVGILGLDGTRWPNKDAPVAQRAASRAFQDVRIKILGKDAKNEDWTGDLDQTDENSYINKAIKLRMEGLPTPIEGFGEEAELTLETVDQKEQQQQEEYRSSLAKAEQELLQEGLSEQDRERLITTIEFYKEELGL